jgi:hypothetical protein
MFRWTVIVVNPLKYIILPWLQIICNMNSNYGKHIGIYDTVLTSYYMRHEQQLWYTNWNMWHCTTSTLCDMYYTGLATLGEDPNITPGIEKAVRQCLRQLELLQTVWKNVLPATVYCRAIGEIILQQQCMCDITVENSIAGIEFVLKHCLEQSCCWTCYILSWQPTVWTC